MTLPLRDRLAELYRRLRSLPDARSADEALAQICSTMEALEDELSGLPRQDPPPTPWRVDGRMYPPQQDHVIRLVDGSIVAHSKGHRIECGAKGSILIRNKLDGSVEFSK